ncbi:MAG: penicillin-binding protein activator LpoB [Bacteroidota bacterium]|nr:penicillin-binding protein activator LpoB [Bacteroidota bacterium]
MKRLIYFSALAVLMIALLGACSNRKVQRVSPDQQIDLSGRWNDTDSKQAAEAMTNQSLSEQWLDNFRQAEGRKPVVIVGLVLNKSHEHISAETFIKDLERSFINSGMVRLVQAGEMREALRAERADQQDFASPETMKKWGRELGADFMLQGTINSIVDSYKKESVVYYQINLELSNLETNEIVWIGEKKIKKYIQN